MSGEDKGNPKKIWSAGFYAGRQKALEDLIGGDAVKQSRQESKLNNVSAYERKVFDVIPIAEAWTISQIHTELARVTRTRGEYNSTYRAVHKLLDSGLAQRVGSEKYTRDALPAAPVPSSTKAPKKPKSPESKPAGGTNSKSPLESLYAAVESFQALQEQMRQVSDALESAVLCIEDQFSSQEGDAEKYHQLKQLLADIGGVS